MKFARFVCLTLALSAVAPHVSAQFHLQFDPGQRIWSMENSVVRAVFQLTEQGMFEFRSLTDIGSGNIWAPPPNYRSSPIRFRLQEANFDEHTAYRLVRQAAAAAPRRSYRQSIELEDLRGYGRVLLELEMFEKQPVLRYRIRFQNLRPQAVRMLDADMAAWSFDDRGKAFRAFYVNQWVHGGANGNFEPIPRTLAGTGAPVQLFTGAYGQHCTWLALRDEQDRGLFAGWEFDGRANAILRRYESGSRVDLSAPIQELGRPLAANGTFQIPAAFLGVFQGDWDEAGYRTQRFAEAALTRDLPGGNFPWIVWDSWMYRTDIDEPTLRRNAEIAASLGAEVFVVDLGWARQIGDWRADPVKFPSGLRALSDYVHSLGMKFGLHLPLAEAAATAPVLRNNPDWTSSQSYGYFSAESLCLSHRPVRNWIAGEITRLIDDFQLDWILQDGENMVKRCTKTTHTHDPQDSNYSNAVDGLNWVVQTMLTRRPAVHWENCEDGGNMMTFNMVRNYVTSIAADDSGPMTTRQAIYGITYPFPPRYSDRYMPDEELDTYKTRSYMFGGPWILMNRLAQMRPEDLELLKSEIALYKTLRERIRDGKVYHLSARPAENRIDALQSHHQETDTSVILAFRPTAAANAYRARPKGLKPERSYRVRFQDDRRLLTMTGAQIMEGGIRINLPGMWTAEFAYIEPIAN
ncbi:MAG: alpha-galactosidase [Acidobacteria bacterium]|nr:alpha-galactosidase [Acidobacteriota bacterium]